MPVSYLVWGLGKVDSIQLHLTADNRTGSVSNIRSCLGKQRLCMLCFYGSKKSMRNSTEWEIVSCSV